MDNCIEKQKNKTNLKKKRNRKKGIEEKSRCVIPSLIVPDTACEADARSSSETMSKARGVANRGSLKYSDPIVRRESLMYRPTNICTCASDDLHLKR